jgi:hypothetical protein
MDAVSIDEQSRDGLLKATLTASRLLKNALTSQELLTDREQL